MSVKILATASRNKLCNGVTVDQRVINTMHPSTMRHCHRYNPQARPRMSFVDHTVDLVAKFFKSRVWGKLPEGSTLIFGGIQISL